MCGRQLGIKQPLASNFAMNVTLFARAENLDRQTAAGHECRRARLISGTQKFDQGLGRFLHDVLHWLDASRTCCVYTGAQVSTRQCLAELCVPTSRRAASSALPLEEY